MALKPTLRSQPPPVQPRRETPPRAASAAPGNVRVSGPAVKRAPAPQAQATTGAAPKAAAQQVMAHRGAQPHKANATYVAGPLKSPLAKITQPAPRLGPGFVSAYDALAFLGHHFPSTKKTS